jgi:hypothetical protein
MAIDGGDVKFSFTGDSSDLNSALSKASKNLDGLTVAGQGAANKISKDLNKATTKASKQLDDFTESAGDADSVMMGLAGAIDLVNPALGDMVRTAGDALAGTEAMGRALKFSNPIFLALATAAGVLGAAYFLLSEDDAAAEESAKKHKEEREKLADLFKTHAQVVTELTAKNKVLSGETTAYAQALNEARFSATTVSEELNKLQAEYDGAAEKHKELRDIFEDDSFGPGGQFIVQSRRLTKEQKQAMDESLVTMQRLGPAVKELSAKQKIEIDLRVENVKLMEADRIARGKTTDANKAGREELDKMIKGLEKGEAAQVKYNKAQENGWKKAAAAWREWQDEQKEGNAAILEQERQQFEARLGYLGEFVNASGDLAVGLAERLGKSAEEQALIEYIASKASALAQIAISTIVASAKVTEQTGIGAAIAVPAVVALGAMQAAAVLATPAPKFHSGGMAPDETLITAQTGEAVLSRSGVAAAGGASGVNALNRGGGGREIVVVNQYRHRVFDSFIMDNLRRTGSPLAAAISATGSKAGIA